MKALFVCVVLLVILGCGDEGSSPTLPVESGYNAGQPLSKDFSFFIHLSDDVRVTPIAKIGIDSTVGIWKLNETASNFMGTGFVVDQQRIATAYHVIDDFTPQDTIAVHPIFDAAANIQAATVAKVNATRDLAILQTANNLNQPKLTLGDSDNIFIGQRCYVVSNPSGRMGTFSEGIINGIRSNREIIEFSSPVSHGSSGAALFDQRGHVIGIVHSVILDANAVYTAIPVNFLKEML